MARPVSKCLKPLRGRRLRVTRLDGCGRPVYGDASSVVSSGFITVAYTANSTETEAIDQQNAAGDRCIYEPAKVSLVGYSAEITFCEVDFELFSLLTGAELRLGLDDEVIGFAVDTSIDLSDRGFALELWTGTSGSDACADPGSTGSFGYVLNPFFQGGIVGDYTVENGAVTFTITGANSRDGSPWGVGPYKDVQLSELSVPGPLLQPVSPTQPMVVQLVDLAPPVAACGARPLLDPASTALTSIAGVVDGLEVDFTTTPAATSPVYWDFGDGTWDYVAAPGATTHTYDAAGTYTVRAQTNGKWVSTTVTVAP